MAQVKNMAKKPRRDILRVAAALAAVCCLTASAGIRVYADKFVIALAKQGADAQHGVRLGVLPWFPNRYGSAGGLGGGAC